MNKINPICKQNSNSLSFGRTTWRSLKNNLGILAALFVLCIILSFATDKFFTGTNIITVLRQVSINAIAAFGMTFVIILCGIDLSVGSVMSLCGVFTCVSMTNFGFPWQLAILVGVLLGAVVGGLEWYCHYEVDDSAVYCDAGDCHISREVFLILLPTQCQFR